MSRVWPQDQQEMGWPGAPNDDAWPADHGWPSGAGEQAGADGSWSAGTARTADSGAWPAVDSWPEEQQTHGQQGHGQQGHGGAAGYGGPARRYRPLCTRDIQFMAGQLPLQRGR